MNEDYDSGPDIWVESKMQDLRDRIEALEAALRKARELAEEGWSYADPYFRAKWRADERLAEIRAVEQGGTGDAR